MNIADVYPELGLLPGRSGGLLFKEVRILSPANVVRTMASYGSFMHALRINTALEEIEEGSGTRYDSEATAGGMDDRARQNSAGASMCIKNWWSLIH
jgi:hypothetical protein